MKNEIQKLIKKLNAETAKAVKNAKTYEKLKDRKTFMYYQGASMAFDVSATLLTLLLNSENETQR